MSENLTQTPVETKNKSSLDRPMTKRQFLKYLGTSLAVIFGVPEIARIVDRVYGGDPSKQIADLENGAAGGLETAVNTVEQGAAGIYNGEQAIETKKLSGAQQQFAEKMFSRAEDGENSPTGSVSYLIDSNGGIRFVSNPDDTGWIYKDVIPSIEDNSYPPVEPENISKIGTVDISARLVDIDVTTDKGALTQVVASPHKSNCQVIMPFLPPENNQMPKVNFGQMGISDPGIVDPTVWTSDTMFRTAGLEDVLPPLSDEVAKHLNVNVDSKPGEFVFTTLGDIGLDEKTGRLIQFRSLTKSLINEREGNLVKIGNEYLLTGINTQTGLQYPKNVINNIETVLEGGSVKP